MSAKQSLFLVEWGLEWSVSENEEKKQKEHNALSTVLYGITMRSIVSLINKDNDE
jgi:hypothetical protein